MTVRYRPSANDQAREQVARYETTDRHPLTFNI